MCDACDQSAASLPLAIVEPKLERDLDTAPKPFRLQRKKLWELSDSWHCGLIGTCLSLKDLRALARKLGVVPKPGFPVDYQLHGHFVTKASAGDKTSKMLQGLLDKRHARAIKHFSKVTSEPELTEAWERALDDGDIPGPYWAIASHPCASDDLLERMYADVHMLSHLVGSSNRADIRRLNALEHELSEIRQSLEAQQARHTERMAEKDQEIQGLSKDLAEARANRAIKPCESIAPPVEVLAKLMRQHETISTVAKALRVELKDRDKENADLIKELGLARAHCQRLERLIEAGIPGPCEADCPRQLNLEGRCILYVGGKTQSVHRYRDVIARCNGELLHHDGGLEESMAALQSALAKADTVVFPCDRISHMAVGRLKKLCQSQAKDYVPLRTCGLASLMAGLESKCTQSVLEMGDD